MTRKVLFISTARSSMTVKGGEINALIDDGEGDGAEKYADHRTEAAGQQHPAHDDRDDGVEDEGHAGRNLGDIEEDRLTDTDEGGADGGKDKKRHRQLVSGNTGVAGAHAVAAHGENPVSEG